MEYKNYYLCSEAVINAFPELKHSKPFKSGFKDDSDIYYIAILDFDTIEDWYNKLGEEEQDEVLCQELVSGTMCVDDITLAGMRKNGIFWEIADKIFLTATRNQTMTLYNLSCKYFCTPIELINKILK